MSQVANLRQQIVGSKFGGVRSLETSNIGLRTSSKKKGPMKNHRAPKII